MSTALWIVIVVAAIAVAVTLTRAMMRQRHRRELQRRFGPEYDRVIEDRGDRPSAEKELSERARRRDALDIRPLTDDERELYAQEWKHVQIDFVEQPAQAAERADALIMDVLRTRGYPVEDFDARADLLTADHPTVVAQYREAEALRQEAHANHGENTETLRNALIRYRALFDELVGTATRPKSTDAEPEADEPALSAGTSRTV
jgi:hypothetical protein